MKPIEISPIEMHQFRFNGSGSRYGVKVAMEGGVGDEKKSRNETITLQTD